MSVTKMSVRRNSMFIGRNKEVQTIQETFKYPSRAIALYGKRRVGKTTLVNYVLKDNQNYIYFECIKDTLEININYFIRTCINKGIAIPSYVKFDNFIDVFSYFDSLNQRYYIVIDEYPYLKEMNDSQLIDSHFQNIIDNHLKNINLIISGSQIKMMESLLHEGNALYGRFYKTIELKELNYIETKNFYSTYSIYDSVVMRSIFGGSPFVNENIDSSKSYEENIIDTFLDENSSIYNYADNILLTDVSNELQARRILSYLANSKKKYKEIVDKLDSKNTGLINRSLESLLDLNLVRKVYPINKIGDKKKSYYEISDNVLRFFYTYIYNNKSIINDIGSYNFYHNYIKDSLVTFVSLRFEDQAKEYFSLLSKKGIRNDIKNIGTYYYDDKENATNGQFDVVLETKKGYEIYNVKFYKEPLKVSVMNKEVSEVNMIKELKVSKNGFINVNGFEDNSLPYTQISGEQLYSFCELK